MRKGWKWFEEKAKSKYARLWLFLISFSESSFFLIPPDFLLMALLAARSGRWAYLAFITSLASVLGAIFGYLIGYFVFEPVAQPLITLYSLTEEFALVGDLYTKSTFLAVLTAAFTPIPFKVFVLAGGFFGIPFIPFILASILGRGARFFLVAYISHAFGPRVTERILKDFEFYTLIVCIVASVFFASYFNIPEVFF